MTGTHVPLLGSDLYEVAYLAGGPRRAVETAVVALLADGRLRVTRSTAELEAVDLRRRHPIEAAVLDATGPRAHRSVDGVVRRVRTDARLIALADGLQRAGLVSRRGGVEATAGWAWPAVGLTRAGRQALRRLRSAPPSTANAEALAVALAGPGAWADAELRAAVFTPPRAYLPAASTADLRRARRSSSDAHVGYLGGGSTAAWGGGSGGDFGGGGCGDGGGGGGGGC